MRIPRYRSNVQMTTEAPGRPMTARMRAQPLVNAIEGKANVFNAALQQVNEYAVQRQKMINETKRNEAIFGAKEGLLSLVDRLEADKNPFDIINMDNKTGRWFDGVAKIKAEMRGKVTQTDAELAYFDQQFTQNEISLRFQLKDKLDTAIEARAKASIESRNQQYVDKYSNPFVDFTLFNEESAEIGAMLNQSVKSGYMAPELIEALGRDTINDIMKNVVQGYAGTNPEFVFSLSNYLDVLDEYVGVTDETKLAERDARLAEIDLPNSDWTKILLGSVSRNEARSALATTMTAANKFEAYRNKQLDKLDKATNDQFDTLKNLTFSQALTDGAEQDLEQLKKDYDLIFSKTFIANLQTLDGDGDGKIDGDDFQKELLGFLNRNNRLTVAEQSQLEETIRLGNSIFAQFDDEVVVDQLSQSVVNNLDSRSILRTNKNKLTRATYLAFEQDFANITKEARSDVKTNLNDVIKIVGRDLNFIDKDVITGANRVSLQSTNAVVGQLMRDVLADGSELTTYAKILSRADELIAEERKKMKINLLPIFINLKQDMDENSFFNGVLDRDSTTPLLDLENKYNSLSETEKDLVEDDFMNFISRINQLKERLFFE